MRFLLILGIVAPLFGLILLGWAAGRRNWLPRGSTQALNSFVVKLALPALLFRIIAEAQWSTLWHPGFIAAFSAGMVITSLIGMAFTRGRPLAERSLEALTGAYSNTAFIGIPLCLAAFGSQAGPPPVIASVLTVSVLFALAILLVEFDIHRGRRISSTLAGIGAALIRNPLLVAPAAGAAWMATGWTLPGPVHDMTSLVGAASTPCALVTIGLFLSERTHEEPVGNATIPLLLKLAVQPAVTAVVALWIFRMPTLWANAAILLGALPTGTGPFMLAELYNRDTGVSARAILWSTALSVVTITVLLTVLPTA
ncbi:AEC family transporter [Flavisphingomonas formosensis]|uniref:AEC family transporter n=1 Tax=Flavisphingomonas formosensis TaxID=861534 RepID=UPI0018E057FE|nr:AEC family transporter [Sphingomonas formosensis]